VRGWEFFPFFFLCFEVSEGANVMNMLKIYVNNPHLLSCPTMYSGEGMGGFFFSSFFPFFFFFRFFEM